jgi:hypothetical protein
MCAIARTFRSCGRIVRILQANGRRSPAPIQHRKGRRVTNLNLSIGPLVSLIAGILILVVPRLLNYIVAIYLIVIGLLGLFGGNLHLK